MQLRYQSYSSPLSSLLVVFDRAGVVRALDFADYEARMNRLLRLHYRHYVLERDEAPRAVLQSLDEYFAGNLQALNQIPVATGGTPFQRLVWSTLRQIRPGTTKTYGAIAAEVGSAGAGRAVGAANGANPITIVVPCHRVIGADGTLTGYGGSLPRKQWLLDHERQNGR